MSYLFSTTLAFSFLGLLASAQSNVTGTNDTASGIAGIQASFKNASLVPDLLQSFDPTALMNVTFPGVGAITAGQNLSTEQTTTAPNVTSLLANSSIPTTGNFTLIMVDALAAGTNGSGTEVLHWLANGVTLNNRSSSDPSSSSLEVSTANALVVSNYFPPQPPPGTGLHRYAILLLPQPPTFSPPANLSTANISIDLNFHFKDYVASSNLSQPIAGTFFLEQAAANGTTANGTSAPTPPVSSSLVNATSTPSVTPSLNATSTPSVTPSLNATSTPSVTSLANSTSTYSVSSYPTVSGSTSSYFWDLI